MEPSSLNAKLLAGPIGLGIARRKKMLYRNKLINNRILTVVSGLALAMAGVIGGSDLMDRASSSTAPPVTARIERIPAGFSTTADAVYAQQGLRTPPQFAITSDAVYAAEGIALNQP